MHLKKEAGITLTSKAEREMRYEHLSGPGKADIFLKEKYQRKRPAVREVGANIIAVLKPNIK